MKNAFTFVPQEMGTVLRKTAYSPNIKERMDSSCAIVLDAFKMIGKNFDTTTVVASHDPLLNDHIGKKYFLFEGG